MAVTVDKLSPQDAVDFEVVGIYLQQARIAVYFTLVLALFLAASFYQVVDAKKIILWVVIIFTINFYTIYTSFQFDHHLPAYQINFFRRRQHFIHVLSGLAWGSAFFLLATTSDESGVYRVAAVVGVMIAFSSSSKAASFRGLLGFVLSAACVSAWHFFTNSSTFGWWLFALLGLTCGSLMFGWMMNQYVLGQVENRLLNEDYVEELRTLNSKIEKTNEDFVKRNLELQDIQEQLKMLAAHDVLTGLFNRRYILERIEEKLPEVRRYQLDCCFVIMDIDHFKQVNDHFGHNAGDDVLKTVAQLLTNGIRQGDIVARYGGEEFLLFLPMTGLDDAEVLVERLRITLEEHPHIVEDDTLKVTASFGIAKHDIHDTAEKSIARADKALYKAKETGRNRTVTSPNAS